MSSQIVKETGVDRTTMHRPRECCGITFTDSMVYAQHRYQEHFEFPELRCERCPDRVFRGQGALTRHIRSHDGFDQRFWAKVHITSACWLWLGPKDTKGYGVVKIHHVQYSCHRVAWERLVGPIPEGMTLDHLCAVRNCLRPEHLEVVTQTENIRRWAKRTKWDGIAGSQQKEPIVHIVPALASTGSNPS